MGIGDVGGEELVSGLWIYSKINVLDIKFHITL